MIPRENFGDVDDLISILASRNLDTLRAYAQACEEDLEGFNEYVSGSPEYFWTPERIVQYRASLEALAKASAAALQIVLDDHDWISAEGKALEAIQQMEQGR